MSTLSSHFHRLSHHFETLTLSGLSPEAKQDLQKFLDQKHGSDSDTGIWSFVKYSLIAIVGLTMLFCLLYFLYQWCKSRTPQFQQSPAMAGYGGYGDYQQNSPVMAPPYKFQQYEQYGRGGGQFNQFGQMQGPNYGANLPVGAGAGYGGYQNLQQVYNQPQGRTPKGKQAKERDLIQSYTWKLDTEGKIR